jgi:importin-7|tara:strand:- start:1747 stop:3303 length:1557 start_codon:yes stop_codon:yes gene_type:complete
VKVDATTALGSFVEAAEDIEQLKPILPQLLDEFFKLMNEVESEDLVFTLETIVEKFGEDIAPYALGLAQNLAAAFWKLTNSQDDKDDDDMNGALACVGCLRAIATILESISTLPHLYGQIEPTLMPILRKMLTQEGYDVYEEILEICSYITYYSPTVTPAMWELWPIMFDALESWGIQYFENVLVPLDNYISRGTEHFLAAPRYRDDVLRLCGTVILANEFPEPECIPAPKLMECVLQNCRGRVDDVVPGYLAVALERLPRCKGKYLKDLLIQVVANCLYYDAPLTLRTLEKNGKTNDALSAWFAMLSARTPNGKRKHHKREHDKKVCALGLTALLRAPAEAMPPAVAQGLGSITSVLVALLDDLKTQMTERKEMEENGYRGHGFWGGGDTDDEGEYVDEDLGDGGDDDPEDEKEPLDEEALRALAMKARKFGQFDPRGGDDDDDDDDSDDDGMLTDDECVTSPMDDVDAFVAFEETMRGASAGDPGRFNAMTGGMDQVRSILHWSPYNPVGVVNADP